MHRRAALVLINLAVILMFAPVWSGGGLVAVTSAAVEAAGYSDFSFQNSNVKTPTGEKPQSKLWYNDGRWWGSMFNRTTGAYHIYWLNVANQTWVDTGTQLDNRPQTKADCLWDGTFLYVVSGGGHESTGGDLPAVLFRYSYNTTTKTYARNFGPITVRNGGAETIVIDKDSTGKLWITYTQSGKVLVNHSTTADNVWSLTAAYSPPLGSLASSVNVSSDDISSLVAFDGKIGVLWSNQNTKSFYFAYHVDGAADSAWTGVVAASQGSTPLADDHINLKSLQADNAGNVFAVVKTSINGTSSSTPQIMLLVRRANGGWERATVTSGAENHTRPFLLIDTEQRMLYVFSSDEGGGNVYYKKTSIDSIQFAAGTGTPFIRSNTHTHINDATSTKQNVNGSTGLVVLASDDTTDWYLHNYLDLGPQGPRVVFGTQPGPAKVNAALAPQPVVIVQDTPGHTNTSYNGAVSIAIKSGTGTPGAALGGAVTVQAVNGIATFSGLSINNAGSGYQLTASAGGMSSAHSSAFSIAKADQAITFVAPPNKTYGDAPFSVAATASSGLAVGYGAAGNCTIAGNTVTITGSGSCTVTASQPGDANFNPAAPLARTFSIAKASQTISFDPLPNKVHNDPSFVVSATASSGLAVSYSAAGSCTSAGNVVTISGAGSCTVTASQPGDANFSPATQVAQTFSIATVFKSYLPLMFSSPAQL